MAALVSITTALTWQISDLSGAIPAGDGEGGHNPTIGIQNISRNISTNAVNGLSDQTIGSDKDGGEKQNGGAGSVMQLEKGRINVRFVSLITSLD